MFVWMSTYRAAIAQRDAARNLNAVLFEQNVALRRELAERAVHARRGARGRFVKAEAGI